MAKMKKTFVPIVTKKVSVQRNHINEYSGMEKKPMPAYGGKNHPCPECDQYGAWINMRDTYGIGIHEIFGCNRCHGWGWIDDKDFNCDHKDRDMTGTEISEANLFLFSHEHAYICTLCKRIEIVDSSG